MALTPVSKQKQFKNIDDLYNYADNRNNELEVKHFAHDMMCEIEHRDGSKFTVTNPCLELVRFTKGTIDQTVYIVYSEHHHPFSYMESDLKSEPTIVPFKKKK